MTSVVDGAQPYAPSGRTWSDRCPGLLRPHLAEDGALVRLRLPGGQTTAATLLELSRIAAEFGSGSVQLTSRGNLQLRGLDQTRSNDLVDRVAATGLLPSVSHERVRNIVASPLTGLLPGGPDVRPMVAAMDSALCASAELAELPGRFLFAVDDGGGDVLTLAFDLGYVALEESRGIVLVGGRTLGIVVARDEAVALIVSLARRFLTLRTSLDGTPWHIAELADPRMLDPRIEPVNAAVVASGATPLGRLGDAASVGVPLSMLDRTQIEAVDRAAAGGAVVVTPWRGLVVPGAAAALPELAGAGLIVDDASVWSQLTACVGAPGCAKSAISTQALAADLAVALRVAPTLPAHVSGCARRCGSPPGRHVDLMAPRSLDHALAEIALAGQGAIR